MMIIIIKTKRTDKQVTKHDINNIHDRNAIIIIVIVFTKLTNYSRKSFTTSPDCAVTQFTAL